MRLHDKTKRVVVDGKWYLVTVSHWRGDSYLVKISGKDYNNTIRCNNPGALTREAAEEFIRSCQ